MNDSAAGNRSPLSSSGARESEDRRSVPFWGVGALAGSAAAPSAQSAAAATSRRLRRLARASSPSCRRRSSAGGEFLESSSPAHGGGGSNHNQGAQEDPSHTTATATAGGSYLHSFGSTSSAAASSSYDDGDMTGSGVGSSSRSSHSGSTTPSSASSSHSSGSSHGSSRSTNSSYTGSTPTHHHRAHEDDFGGSSLESPLTTATSPHEPRSSTFSTLSPVEGPLSTFTDDDDTEGGDLGGINDLPSELVPPSLSNPPPPAHTARDDDKGARLRPVRVTVSSDARHAPASSSSPGPWGDDAAATASTAVAAAIVGDEAGVATERGIEVSSSPPAPTASARSPPNAPGEGMYGIPPASTPVSPLPHHHDGDEESDEMGTASSDTTQPTSPGRASKARLEQETTSYAEEVDDDTNEDHEGVASWATLVPPKLLPTAAPGSTESAHEAVHAPGPDDNHNVTTAEHIPQDPSGATSFLQQPASSSPGSSPGRRQRVPGGAAAKLLLLGPRDGGTLGASAPTTTGSTLGATGTGDSEETFEESLKEIEITLKLAKQEFELGSPTNRRYHPTVDVDHNEDDDDLDDDDDAPHESGSYTPSFLNRSEVFFASASAAIAALLTPRAAESSANLGASFSSHGSAQGVFFRSATTHSGDHPLGPSPSSASSSAFHTPDASSSVAPPDAASYLSFGRRDVSWTLLPPGTDKKIEDLVRRMHDPTKTLTDLLTAIATPEHPHMMDLGFMVRRKNACGALKVLTADPKKRARIAWTVGVLPALASVLSDAAERGAAETFPDPRICDEYEAARNRAIAALLHLSIPKGNRIPVFHTPGLVQSLLAIVSDDDGDARRGCTAILAYLAKTVENRLLMVQVPGFSNGIVAVLQPLPPSRGSVGPEPRPPAKKRYPWSSESDTESEVTGQPRSNEDEDSDRTPLVMPSRSPTELLGYDDSADELLRASRQNIFAVLKHVGKEKDNAYHIARDPNLLHTLIAVSGYQESASHTLAVQCLANLTRHRLNTKLLVFHERRAVPALVKAANSPAEESRLYACYAIQNMAQDKACRQELAAVDGLVSTLCNRGRYAAAEPERLAAISALKNLCDEPANLIPLTNTPACVATLMHLAHGKEEGVTEMMQYRACDALATLSHWLRKIATSGKSLDAVQRGQPPEAALFVPSLRVVTWNQWE